MHSARLLCLVLTTLLAFVAVPFGQAAGDVDVTFNSSIAGPGVGGVTGANKVALITGEDSTTAGTLVRKGDLIALDADGNALMNTRVKTLSDPVVGRGKIAFPITLSTGAGGIGYSTDGTMWRLLAHKGALAPGGGKWATFQSLVLPRGAFGGPIFLAKLASNGPAGISGANNTGLWAVDSFGSLRLLLRTGDSPTGKKIRSMSALVGSASLPGGTSGYDDHHAVGVLATFSDGSQGLLEVTVP